ncbi:MAG: ectonucleotide pyrophosphatase/phosphodiesterase, partial [Woeseia sp.]
IAPQDERAAARRDAPYLVLISIDGFRHDYLDRFPTPALQRIASQGIRAKALRPVWPTLTFPNHYSIATGLYPHEHGIIGNDFMNEERDAWYHYKERDTVQDGRWYHGEPIWVAAERAGIGAAAFYFVGTEAAVDGIAPSDWRPFDASVAGADRIDQALVWLALPENERPHVITLYFEHVDSASHSFGAASPQCVAAIHRVDEWIGDLLDGIDSSPIADKVTVAVVSDHGQSGYRNVEPLVLSDFVSLDDIEYVENGPMMMLYVPGRGVHRARELRDAINARWQHGRAWLPADAPSSWRIANSPRMADVILQADPGYAVISHRDRRGKLNKGDHGWAPEFADMHGIFMAMGPGLPQGRTTGVLDAVDIYPLLLRQLDLPDRRATKASSPLLSFPRASFATTPQP